MIERRQTTVQFGFLCRRQLHLMIVETIPKLRDDRKPFVRRQARELAA
jgi:hypothetical protein